MCKTQLGVAGFASLLVGLAYLYRRPNRSQLVSVCRALASFSLMLVPLINLFVSRNSPWIPRAASGATLGTSTVILVETIINVVAMYHERALLKIIDAEKGKHCVGVADAELLAASKEAATLTVPSLSALPSFTGNSINEEHFTAPEFKMSKFFDDEAIEMMPRRYNPLDKPLLAAAAPTPLNPPNKFKKVTPKVIVADPDELRAGSLPWGRNQPGIGIPRTSTLPARPTMPNVATTMPTPHVRHRAHAITPRVAKKPTDDDDFDAL